MWICKNCKEELKDILDVCWNCNSDKKGKGMDSNIIKTKQNEDPKIQSVKIKDIEMPFGSMVGFIFKWTFASIPTALFIFVIVYLLQSWISNN